jgi:transcriptional regulator
MIYDKWYDMISFSVQIFNKTVESAVSVNTVFREFTNIDRKACNNITEAVNTLTLSAHLDHSCETDYSKQIHSFITG